MGRRPNPTGNAVKVLRIGIQMIRYPELRKGSADVRVEDAVNELLHLIGRSRLLRVRHVSPPKAFGAHELQPHPK